MAFTGDFMCDSFLQELMEGLHNFLLSGGDDMSMALYDNSASFTAATTAYTATNEITGTNYVAEGQSLTRIDPSIPGSNTAIADFADEVWGTATFSAWGALVYNETAAGDESVIVLDFGGQKTATAGDFTVQFPVADASNAIIRLVGP